MTTTLFAELDLARFGAILCQILGEDSSLVFLDRSGTVVWRNRAGAEERAGAVLAELARRDLDGSSDPGEFRRVDLAGGATLLTASVHADNLGEVGRILLIVEPGRSGGPGKTPEDAGALLVHVASSAAQEYILKFDVDKLASELSERYEELNLLYSMEKQVRDTDAGTLGIEVLLQNFAQHLAVDVAALVLPRTERPIHATNLSQPLPNLDLILTQVRGDLFRFLWVSREPLVINELGDPRRRYILSGMPFKILACPIREGRSVDAMLALLRHPDAPDFTNSDRNLATVIANQTSIILRNQAMVKKLRGFGQEMASALIEAIESKDPYTRGHSERVQGMASQLASSLGMEGDSLESIYWGALLHDVGKLGVPDVILCKPGRLTEDEYTFIKIHPERSYEILRHVGHLSPQALDGARYHQEKWDGSGYPNGLKGNEIPYSARVIAVADTYDAITSSRAYRPGRTHEEAMAIIHKISGVQLDPDITQSFERLCSGDLGWLEAIVGDDDPTHG